MISGIARYFCFFLLASFCFADLSATAQTGGTVDLSHSVVASGGGSNSNGGAFNVSGTVGQNIAGTTSNGGVLVLRGGFWFSNFIPTAAAVSIIGRVQTASGQGVRNVSLTLISPDGAIRKASTSTFGYYAFDGVEVGQTYILEISSKRYVFQDARRVLNLQDHVTDMNFTAEPQ